MARAIEHHLVGPVMQKRRAAFHRLKDPAFAFDAKPLRRNPFPFGDPAHQRSGLMDSQIVEHEMPLPWGSLASSRWMWATEPRVVAILLATLVVREAKSIKLP